MALYHFLHHHCLQHHPSPFCHHWYHIHKHDGLRHEYLWEPLFSLPPSVFCPHAVWFMSVLHAKYINLIPASPKVLTLYSIKLKSIISPKSHLLKISQPHHLDPLNQLCVSIQVWGMINLEAQFFICEFVGLRRQVNDPQNVMVGQA